MSLGEFIPPLWITVLCSGLWIADGESLGRYIDDPRTLDDDLSPFMFLSYCVGGLAPGFSILALIFPSAGNPLSRSSRSLFARVPYTSWPPLSPKASGRLCAQLGKAARLRRTLQTRWLRHHPLLDGLFSANSA
jgi:hypothetical protein